MLVKDFKALVKATGDGDDQGQFTALVSVFGNEDSYGDVVMPGAFSDDLADWKASGNPIPVIWSHDWSDPFSHIGMVTDAEETDKGLQVTGSLDMDNPKAVQVYRLLKGGRVTQFSFAYDVLDGGFGQKDGTDVYELRKLKVHEVGPTLVGANQETELLAVKAAAIEHGVKEGRVLAQKHVDSLKEAHATLGNVITAAEKAEEVKTAPALQMKVFLGDEDITEHVTVTKNDPQISVPEQGAEHEEKTGQPPADANDPGPRAGDSSACEKRLSHAQVLASIDLEFIEADLLANH